MSDDLLALEPADPSLLVHVDHVIAGYVPEVNILNGCSLELGGGELIGIIGPNGAGKSTMLKALFGLIAVREGTVMYRGEDVTGQKANTPRGQGDRLRAADQQRVPVVDGQGEPRDGRLPAQG